MLAQITALQATLASLQQGGSTNSGSCPVLTRNLSRGSTGTDVAQLQQSLIAQNLLSTDSATGYFGSLTAAAVQTWQSTHGIEPVGVVGPVTRAAFAQCE